MAGLFDFLSSLGGDAPPPPPQQPQLMPQSSLGGNIGAGLQSFANSGGGLFPAISNAIAGFATGQRADPQGMKLQALQSVYTALQSSGIPEPLARAAALDPQIMQVIAAKSFGTNPKQVVQTGTSSLGLPIHGVFDPQAGSIAPIVNGQVAGQGQAPQPSPTEAAMSAGVSGPDFLKTIEQDPAYGKAEANIISKMVSGDLAPPSSFALGKPQWATRIALASQLDPAFSSLTWAQRYKVAQDAATGTLAKNNNALNTGIGHLTQLADAVGNLHNGEFQLSNYVKNLIGPIFGATGPTNFEAIKNRVAPEITKIWRSSGGAEADIQRDLDTLSDSKTPEQLYGAISNIAGLMESKIQANKKQYSDAMGPHGRSPDFMISPENQTALEKLRSAAAGQAPQQQAIPPAEQRQVGTVYSTPKGKARWMGNGWQMVQ